MDSFEFNKYAGAVLSGLLTMTVIGFIGNALVHPQKLEQNAYPVAVAEQTQQTQQAAAPAAAEPITPLLASANVQAGQAVAKQCTSCHTFEKGGANRVGPNLWGIIGTDKAHVQGFNYSQAMQSAPGNWTYEDLDKFLADPKAAMPGTRMTFAGVKKTQDRANLVAWLRTQADNPAPLP
ncbi:MAG TPA: cytochrome c family protein [Alphaproteobacteria bacterium]|nr:cytochrome c family protein [Alphaproteobacteria bacterium]